jgi:hypothetical protein
VWVGGELVERYYWSGISLYFVLPEGVTPSDVLNFTVVGRARGTAYKSIPFSYGTSDEGIFTVKLFAGDGSSILLAEQPGSFNWIDFKRTFTPDKYNMTKLFSSKGGGGPFVTHYYITLNFDILGKPPAQGGPSYKMDIDYITVEATYKLRPGAYELMFSLGPTGHLFISEAWIPVLIFAGLLIIIPPGERKRERKRGRPGRRKTPTFQW